MNIAIFCSTRGSTLQAFIEASKASQMPNVEIKVVIADRECGAAEKAKKAGIPVVFLDPNNKEGEKLPRESYDRQLDKICQMYGIDLIVLSGFLRILSPWFVKKYPKKITNIHPSLLPKHAGLMDIDVHRDVLKNHEKETGMTIHYVDKIVDHGEIIVQKRVPVAPNDTPESLKEKVLALEKEWYPKVIASLWNG